MVGPPKCGKTTLIKSLVKHYTKQSVQVCANAGRPRPPVSASLTLDAPSLPQDIKGPITVVSGKKRRLTFFECPR